MERLKMHSNGVISSNLEVIEYYFPECITEAVDERGQTVKAVDFARLKSCLACRTVDESNERYVFTWPNKADAIRLADARTSMTLRPCREESIAFDSTGNLFIEGDNLDVLKVLRNTYRGRVKMIYIDPPYNTGSDFVYDDDFKQSLDEYLHTSNQLDEQGNRLIKNVDSNGRFHTDWLNMIYPRLKVARELLTDDGVIFISIDDHEAENLKKVCCELFGDKNFVSQFIWQRAYAPKNDAKYVSVSHDYVLMFAKHIDNFKIGRLPRSEKTNARYKNPDNDPRGLWKSDNLTVKSYSASGDFSITTPSGRVVNPPPGSCWRVNKETFEAMVADNRIWFGPKGSASPSIKRFLSELKKDGMTPTSMLMYDEVGHSQEASQDLNALMDLNVFDGPKPLRLLKHLMCIANLGKDDIVLDFFGGSCSTAHALMDFNLDKHAANRFILVQIPEPIDPKDPAFKAGYTTIADIGKERIRRACKAIATKQQELITQPAKNAAAEGSEAASTAATNADADSTYQTIAPNASARAAAATKSATASEQNTATPEATTKSATASEQNTAALEAATKSATVSEPNTAALKAATETASTAPHELTPFELQLAQQEQLSALAQASGVASHSNAVNGTGTGAMAAFQGATAAVESDADRALDLGFRVLKLDTSNMLDAYYLPQELSLSTLVEDNIKPDRSAEDLLFQCLLETDVLLSSPIAVELIAGKQVFDVNGGYLIACFDEDIDIETIKAIAHKKPAYFITRDAALHSDDVADNLEQVFRAFSCNTTIKVL